MRVWRLVNWCWGVLFVVAAGWILVRSTDGTGAVQTWSLRLVALGVLIIFFILIAVVQLLWKRWLTR